MINSYGTQDLRYIDSRIFQKIKNNRIVTNGNYCKLFERKISKLVKARYAVACNNGTSAIMMSILALNKKKYNCNTSKYKFRCICKYNKSVKR